MSFTKVAVAVAAMAVALLAPAVRAEPQEVIRTATAAGVVEALEQEVAVATSGDRDVGPALNATYSNYIEMDGKYTMTVSRHYPTDERSPQSYYVCGSSMDNRYITFKFSSDPEDEDGSALMQVESAVGRSSATWRSEGWYLSVLYEFDADTPYKNCWKVCLQPFKAKATKWYFPPGAKQGSKYMRVRNAPGLPEVSGMDLNFFRQRDSTSKYLRVCKDRDPLEIKLK